MTSLSCQSFRQLKYVMNIQPVLDTLPILPTNHKFSHRVDFFQGAKRWQTKLDAMRLQPYCVGPWDCYPSEPSQISWWVLSCLAVSALCAQNFCLSNYRWSTNKTIDRNLKEGATGQYGITANAFWTLAYSCTCTTGKNIWNIWKAKCKHSKLAFWFAGNSLASSTNKYCDFKATLTCSAVYEKCNLHYRR